MASSHLATALEDLGAMRRRAFICNQSFCDRNHKARPWCSASPFSPSLCWVHLSCLHSWTVLRRVVNLLLPGCLTQKQLRDLPSSSPSRDEIRHMHITELEPGSTCVFQHGSHSLSCLWVGDTHWSALSCLSSAAI